MSDLMAQNCFDEILWYLHLTDDSNLNGNYKLAKAKPLYNLLKKKLLQAFQLDEHFCVDEKMLSYYGRRAAK